MAKKNNKTNLLTNTIVIKSPQRKSADVGEWRNALRSADNGRVKRLFELYDDLLIDGILSDAISKRIEAVTNTELTFLNAKGEEVQEITELIDSPAWEELLTQIMQSKFYGRSAVEFDFKENFDVYEIPKKHIDLINKQILIQETDATGISYVGDDNILVIGKKRDFGLLLKTAPFTIWKRGGFGDYAQWLEVFGMPQRIGKYSSYDTESRILLEQALAKAGSAPWLVIPKETEVETTNNNASNGSGISYNQFRQACNEEIIITILGQTLTTVQGERGARSLGEVHKQIEEGKHKADLRYTQRILNYHVLPLLQKKGFKTNNGYFVFPASAEDLSVTDIVQLSKLISIPTYYLHDKYSIPKPKDGDDIAGQNTNTDKVKEEQEKLKKENKKLQDRLKSFFAIAPTQKERGKKTYVRKLIDSITNTRVKLSEEYSINLNKLINEAIRLIYGGDNDIVNKELFNISNNALQNAVNYVFDSEPEFGKNNREFINEFKFNTAIFSAFKNHKQTEEIKNLMTDENGNLRPFYKFKKLAIQISKEYNVKWLQTEYNTAVKSARTAVNYRNYLKTKHIYPNLEYIESSAENKRDRHLGYVGTILPIEHWWWNIHLPPADWNCACSVRQTDKEVTPIPDAELVNEIFANNPGITAKFINIKKHPYYQETKEEDKEKVTRIAELYIQKLKKTQNNREI